MSRNSQNKIHNLQTMLNQFTDHEKSYKKCQSVGVTLFIMTIRKPSNINIASDLGTCHKYVMQFTDPIRTNHWYVTRVKLTFFNMPILNTIQ